MLTTLGTDKLTDEPLTLEDVDRSKGVYVIGQMGTGKSTLLLTMAVDDLQKGKGLCLIDPHGDLVDDLLSHITLANQTVPDKLVILDPSDTAHPFGLNIFECPDPQSPAARSLTVNYIVSLFRKLWGDPRLGVNIHDVMAHVAQVFVRSQKYTLVDVPLFLENESFRMHVLGETPLSPPVRQFWDSYNERTDQRSYIASTLNKVRDFTNSELLYPILGQTKSTIDVADIMDNSKILLVKLAEGLIGEEPAALLGSIITGQMLQAMLSRTSQNKDLRTPFGLYCDEYHLFASSDFNRFFSEGRKFGIQVTVAHQWRGQLESSDRDATAAVANRIAFRVSANDATEMRRWFRVPERKNLVPISLKPLEYIMKHGHPSAAAMALAEFMTEIINGRSRLVQHGGGDIGRYISQHVGDTFDTQIPKVINDINKYLYESMNNIFEYLTPEGIAEISNCMRTLVRSAAVTNQMPLVPKTKINVSDVDFHNIMSATSPEFIPTIINLSPHLRPIEPIVVVIWKLARTAFDLRENPVREHPYDTHVYDVDQIEPEFDITSLPVGTALIRYANGADLVDGVLQTFRLNGTPRDWSEPRVNNYIRHSREKYNRPLDDVDQEIYERQKIQRKPNDTSPRIRRTT